MTVSSVRYETSEASNVTDTRRAHVTGDRIRDINGRGDDHDEKTGETCRC